LNLYIKLRDDTPSPTDTVCHLAAAASLNGSVGLEGIR
jgi:hypothetical protein